MFSYWLFWISSPWEERRCSDQNSFNVIGEWGKILGQSYSRNLKMGRGAWWIQLQVYLGIQKKWNFLGLNNVGLVWYCNWVTLEVFMLGLNYSAEISGTICRTFLPRWAPGESSFWGLFGVRLDLSSMPQSGLLPLLYPSYIGPSSDLGGLKLKTST